MHALKGASIVVCMMALAVFAQVGGDCGHAPVARVGIGRC